MTFSKKNYILMIVGVVLLILGFILLSGGGSDDPVNTFSYEIYSFRRLWVAPIILVAGFVVEAVAIFKNFESKKEASK